ncbi:hypothetical protein [uncultured Microbacterium sp.]|uniref:COG4315 family predicted lipoprotein n=1 Tax=uncultured Microbacterium sp. TaxID=191216 RepID=UPI0035C9CE4D
MTSGILRRAAAAVLLASLVALAGCAAPDPDEQAARAASLSTIEIDGLGDVLVDGKGSVLYVFEPDQASAVTCTFTCTTNWPPLDAVAESTPAATGGVDAGLLATLPNPGGGEVITYNGWPLYRYDADRSPGDARGQATTLNGGAWYVMAPDGEPIR